MEGRGEGRRKRKEEGKETKKISNNEFKFPV